MSRETFFAFDVGMFVLKQKIRKRQIIDVYFDPKTSARLCVDHKRRFL